MTDTVEEEVLARLLLRLAELAGDPPRDVGTYRQALTHPSWVNEAAATAESNQRLEFLGDAVLQLVVSDHIFRLYPERAEGELTRLRSAAVRERALAQAAQSVGLGPALRLGRGEEVSGGRERISTLADAFEAVVGAVYLDLGLVAARRFALAALRPILESEAVRRQDKDPKSILQEYVQRWPDSALGYELLQINGPDHDRRFHVAVTWRGRRLGTGEGRSKKEAEQQAAEAALATLQTGNGDA